MVIDQKVHEKLEEEKYLNSWNSSKDGIDWNIINNITAVAIAGKRRSGKTALAYYILMSAKKPVYFYKHPNPRIIKKLGFNILYNLDIRKLQNCIIYIDEPQLFIKKYDKKANDGLTELLSIAAQNDICIIMSTSDTRFITKGLESYIDVWLVKDIETDLIKRGSLISKIIRRNCLIDVDNFSLNVAEYLFYARDYPQYSGQHEFELPDFWTEEYSKPFANRHANPIAKIIQKVI
jgi:hypothetical protein